MIIFVICNCQPDETISNPIQWPKVLELEVPTIGLYTLLVIVKNIEIVDRKVLSWIYVIIKMMLEMAVEHW